MPKVVVRGTAINELNPLNNADISEITEKDIDEQQFVTLGDALRRVPGVYVRQSGGVGQESRVSIRGTGEQNTTVIVNGMSINDSGSFDNAFNLSRWTLDDISDIQVIQGPMSSLYGPGGMGGVVLINTKTGKGPHKNFAKAEGGSFATYSQMAGLQGQRQLFDYYVAGSRIQSAGARTVPKRYFSPSQEKLDNPLHQETINARFGMGRESSHVSFVSRYLSRRLGYRQTRVPGLVDNYAYRSDFTESFNRLQGHFETSSGAWVHDLGLGYYHNDLLDTHPVLSNIKQKAAQSQIDWRQSYEFSNKMQLQLATDYAKETLYWYKLPALNNNFSVSHGGIGGSITYTPFENVTLTGSSRIDKYQGIASTMTYRLGARYELENTTLKGGLGTAFKAPSLKQKYYKDSWGSGNPNLKPERSLGWDVGVERPFMDRKFTIGFIVFQNRIHDLITGSPGGLSLINMDKARTQGLEGLIRYQPTSLWTIEVTHTYTQAWDLKTGHGLMGNPRNKTALCVTKQAAKEWFVSANVLYISPRYTFDAVSFKKMHTPSYTIVGAETYYQLTDQWQVYGRGENLLNRQYENPQSFQQPGLGIYVGLRAQC
jgi:vitamin B12 transporter